MAISDVILWHKAVVFDALFGEEVYGVGFLQKSVSDVLFILKNCPDIAGMPLLASRAVQDTVRFEVTSNFQYAGTFEVFPVDGANLI
nr:hypothetical protein [Pelolinea submarina]